MTGEVNFMLKSFYDNLNYDLKFQRKITIITGNSGIGKSDLIRLLSIKNKEKLRISVLCDYEVKVLTNDSFEIIASNIKRFYLDFSNHDSKKYYDTMRNLLKQYDNYLFFADEDFDYLTSKEFASFCKFTDSYYVLISHIPLSNLPYSYTEIYTLNRIKQTNILHRIFDLDKYNKITDDVNHLYITEDAKSGFQFFSTFYKYVESAESKSKIVQKLKNLNFLEVPVINIIADGAAFGSEMDNVLYAISQMNGKNVLLFLPESFEYLILSSDLFKGINVFDCYSNNALFFSHERYYTYVLENLTNGTQNAYNKSQLNECYFISCCPHRINKRCILKSLNNKKYAILNKYFLKNDLAYLSSSKIKQDGVKVHQNAMMVNAFINSNETK